MDELTGRSYRSSGARRRIFGAVAVAAIAVGVHTSTPAMAASLWTVAPAAGSHGQARGATLGTTTATAHCAAANSTNVNVTWTAVAHAASYTVLYATAVNGPYMVAASGQTGTSFTAAGATGSSYWVEVQAVLGSWTTTSNKGGPVAIAAGPSCTG